MTNRTIQIGRTLLVTDVAGDHVSKRSSRHRRRLRRTTLFASSLSNSRSMVQRLALRTTCIVGKIVS